MGFGGAMMCFRNTSSEKKEDHQTKSSLNRSSSEVNSVATSVSSADSIRRTQLRSLSQRGSNLRVFSVTELKTATKNFSRSVMLGEGGFGCVYMGTIKNSSDSNTRTEIAVKQLGRRGLQGHKEWMTEVNVLGVVHHPNLVKLIGYCADDDERGTQRLLVYEYMPNGSVEDHLSSRSTKLLSWPVRLRIALDAARGLSYLHEGMDFQIIFRDLKTSNILLDEQWNAKLSDFGLAREGPEEGLTHVSTAVVGTLGYAAPEYMHTGRLTAKSDVWSFGVVLYELITGRRPIDKNRPKTEQNLLEWVKPYISDVKKFRMIIDPRLDARSTLKSAMHLSVVANRCLVRQAKSRPTMTEVMEMLRKIVGNTDMEARLPSPESSPASKKNRLGLKRGLGELKKGEGKRLLWRRWTPKLIKTH